MMPVIRVSDPVFGRLQDIATPLVDTPGSVIEKLLDFYESHNTKKPVPAAKEFVPLPTSKHIETVLVPLSPDSPPDLAHTRVSEARFASNSAANWNELVLVAHRVALDTLKSFDALRSSSLSNITVGSRNDGGFHYDRKANLSIQNVDANLAWRNALHLARKLKMPVRVTFQWRHKDGAAHPGLTATLEWLPT